MHSNWKPWDYIKSFANGYNPTIQGLQVISAPDEYIQIVIRHLFDNADTTFRVKFAEELNVEWVEQEFCSLSLFQQTDSYIVYLNNQLSEDVIEFLETSDIDFSNRFLIFLGTKVPTKLKKFAEKQNSHLVIEAPKFWETREQLEFFAHHFKLYFSQESKNYLLESLDISSEVLFETFSRLKSFFEENHQISLNEVKQHVQNSQLDRFALAREFGFKRIQAFYQKLLATEKDFQELREFFSFMQGHIIKMLDPSYSRQKKYLSKYDKEIQGYSRLWQRSELCHFLETFADFEILCKSQDDSLKTQLRLRLLESYK